MANPVDTWMPLYIGDALRETIGLTLEERGAYAWLNMSLWQSGGSLPFDPPRLARAIGCDVATFGRIWESLSPIYVVSDGMVRSPRLDEHLARAIQAQKSLAERGKDGAAKRWHGRAMAEPSPSHGRGMAGDAPSPSPSKPTATPAKATTPRAVRSEGEADLALADRMRASVKDAQPTWTEPVWKRERERYAKAIRLARESDGRSPEMLAELCARWGELPQQARAWCETHPMDWKRDVAKLHGMLNGQQRPTDSRRGVLYTGTDAEFEEMARKYGRADG